MHMSYADTSIDMHNIFNMHIDICMYYAYDRPTLVACLFQSAVTFELMGQITHNAHISD